MKTWEKAVIAISIFNLAISTAHAQSNSPTTITEVKRVIEEFCQAEFKGTEERYDYAKFSREYEAKKRAEGNEFDGHVNVWDWDPLFVVASYKVRDVDIKDNHASAIVVYKRLAQSKGHGRITPDYVGEDVVKYNLIYDGAKWWLVDPPLPRISKDALVAIYKGIVDRMGPKWLEAPGRSEAQKQYYRERVETLKILQSLQG